MSPEVMKKKQEETVRRQSQRAAAVTCETITYENEGCTHAVDVYHPDPEVFPGKRPGILFFFGGGFALGCRHAFREQAQICAESGIVAATADYRISTVHGSKPRDSFCDGTVVWNLFREKADEWNMDPGKLFLSGGSAGAMIAFMCGQMTGVQPAGYILFNPGILDDAPDANNIVNISGAQADGFDVINTESLKQGTAKMLVLHGEKDHIILKTTVERFVRYGKENGVDVRLKLYPGMDHGFFNFNRSRPHFYMTIGEALIFISEN